MSTQATTRVGQAKISIEVRGCVDCGAEHNHHWEPARTIRAMLNGHWYDLQLSRCGHCAGVPEPTEAA